MNKHLILTCLTTVLVVSSCTNKPATQPVTVTFDLNYEGASTYLVDVTYNSLVKEPTAPSRTGYYFNGWYTTKECQTLYNFQTKVISDITLYAGWEKETPVVTKYTVTLNTNGGEELEPVKVDANTLFSTSLFPTPVRSQLLFQKWTFDNDQEIPNDYRINSDITIKAQYQEDAERYIKDMNVSSITDASNLFECSFAEYDYTWGEQYLHSHFGHETKINGLCSTVASNGFFGRNFDYEYGYTPEFIIHTTKQGNRHASVGVSLSLFLSKNNIGNKTYLDGHKILPFMTMDGVNDAGLAICMNEVSRYDMGLNPGTDPKHSKTTVDLHEFMLVRYLLDNASDIEEAKVLMEKVNIYNRCYQEMHFMLMDKNGHSSVVEFEFTDSSKTQKHAVWYDQTDKSYYQGVSTNFPMTGYQGDAKTYYEASSSLMNHAEGVERYNILYDKLKQQTISSVTDMLNLLKEAYYSKTYSIPLEDNSKDFWFTEFNNLDQNHIKTTAHTYANYNTDYYQKVMKSFNARTRAASTPFYITTHSCCYDLKNLTLNLVYEETKLIDKTFTIKR